MIKVAVVGSSSMVGSRFCQLAQNNMKIIPADFQGQNPIDITNKKSVDNFFKSYEFDCLILFSAFTDVDEAEKQKNDKKGSCWQINVKGVDNIVQACKASKAKLIFISTDYVFEDNGPSSEDEKVSKNPEKISWYGQTKIEGEKIISDNLEDFLILRIAYPYRGRFEEKDDIVKRFLKLYRDKKLYPVFADQIITPTFIDDLFPAILLLIQKNQKGIFHVASPKTTTPYQLARKAISVFGGNPNVVPKGSLSEFLKNPDSTPRPIKGGLRVDKIKSLGFTPTSWDSGIEIIFRQSQGQLI